MLLRMDGVSVGNIDEWDGIGVSVCREGVSISHIFVGEPSHLAIRFTLLARCVLAVLCFHF